MQKAVTDYAARAERYARWATSSAGSSRVCRWVRLAAERQQRDLARAASDPDWGYYYSPRHVAAVCSFVELLPHVEGQWPTPTLRLEDWQIFILSCVFGWRRRVDGGRRFGSVYIELPRKQGKSVLSSAVALYCLTCDGEPGPQIKTAATTGDQARIVFDVARKMVRASPALREAFSLEARANAVVSWANMGDIRPINARASTQDGLNPHMYIIDELHAHRDRALFDVLRSARGARRNPLAWYITTAGYNTDGVCYEQRELVNKILDGVVDADHYFGIIYTIDAGDDEFDPATWRKANPNWGVSVQPAEFASYAAEAKISPASHVEFRAKRLNVWTNARTGWVNLPRWKACDGAVDLDALRTVRGYAGLDLAATQDTCSFRVAWLVDGRLKTWGMSWVPEDIVADRLARGDPLYHRWVADGWLRTMPGDTTDTTVIERDITAALDRLTIDEIAYDPWNALDLSQRLAPRVTVVEFRQTAPQFALPMRALEQHYLSGTLDHGGDPVMTWYASNVVARRDVNDNVAPDRKAGRRIDGFVALLMALSRAMVHHGARRSAYETRGFRAL